MTLEKLQEKEKGIRFFGLYFRPSLAKNKKGRYFVSFSPAVSKKAEGSIREKIRSMKIQSCTTCDIDTIADLLNLSVRGWLNYYGKFRKSALRRICARIQLNLVKRAKNKFRNLKNSWVRAYSFMRSLLRSRPKLFVHWEWGCKTALTNFKKSVTI